MLSSDNNIYLAGFQGDRNFSRCCILPYYHPHDGGFGSGIKRLSHFGWLLVVITHLTPGA